MSSQQAPRPWFRLASMMRPSTPAPAPPPPTRPPPPSTVLQPTPPLPPFRPPVGAALPQQTTQPPPPQATAPPTPIQLPLRPGPSASRSPVVTSPAPRSPVHTRASQSQPQEVHVSPTITTTPIPGAPVVSASPSPKTNAAPSPSSSRLPTSPQTNAPPPAPAPTSNINTSPYITRDITAPPPPSPVRPIASPRAINRWDRKTPPDQSPVLKPLSHPPSPLILPPPAQLNPGGTDYLEPIPAEPQQKTVLTQNTVNHHDEPPKITNKHGGGGEVKRDTANKTISKSTEDQLGMRIVTLSGENKGAVMEISSPCRKKFQGSGNIIDGDQKEGKKVEPAAPVDALVNSNVQGVNNSILHNCTYRNRDPGVHLSVSRRGNAHHVIKGTNHPP